MARARPWMVGLVITSMMGSSSSRWRRSSICFFNLIISMEVAPISRRLLLTPISLRGMEKMSMKQSRMVSSVAFRGCSRLAAL